MSWWRKATSQPPSDEKPSIISQELIDVQLEAGLASRFHLRSLLKVVRKQEEFKLKQLEAMKKPSSHALVEKYQYYIETLDWVLHGDL